jgi:hypothetical protein
MKLKGLEYASGLRGSDREFSKFKYVSKRDQNMHELLEEILEMFRLSSFYILDENIDLEKSPSTYIGGLKYT